ncbi:prepilin-type N-terminal cleavage/methylation domain-containing protein [Clostridium sp.]|uniref:prepilin-type N-terminal cleavage/methylation domain-containing protein n=1 Tax=Clostridium sp. TaxID=1506 RepID=UPI00260753E8|nr:prepilin-type N-terminal cleavage/methylation domain-containing protein [uncultured Clostridium sp.]
MRLSYNKKKGLTLVELIVAIAIISIVTVGCLPIFLGTYKNIISSGSKTKNVFDAQTKIDSAIQDVNSGSTNFTKTTTQITIQFSDGNIVSTTPISGKTITVNNGQTTLTSFVPDN